MSIVKLPLKILLILLVAGGICQLGCSGSKIPPALLEYLEWDRNLESVLEEIVNTPEEEINLAKYALLMTKAVSPRLDMEDEIKTIDQMASRVRPRLEGVTEPQKIVDVLNKYFFDDVGFKGQALDKYPADYSLLHYALFTKRAHCVTVGIIYLSLAERLNLPVYGVSTPNHFFVRYDDGKTRINIDTTYEMGKNISDEEYLKITAPLIKETDIIIRKNFLTNMSKKEVLETYLLSGIFQKLTSGIYGNDGVYKNTGAYSTSMIRCFDYAIKLGPHSYVGYCKRGMLLFSESIKEEKGEFIVIDGDKLRQALFHLNKSYDLYPYSIHTIWNLSETYYYLGDYENCILKIDELFMGYSADEIVKKYGDADMPSELQERRKYCKEQLNKQNVPDIEDEDN